MYDEKYIQELKATLGVLIERLTSIDLDDNAFGAVEAELASVQRDLDDIEEYLGALERVDTMHHQRRNC